MTDVQIIAGLGDRTAHCGVIDFLFLVEHAAAWIAGRVEVSDVIDIRLDRPRLELRALATPP